MRRRARRVTAIEAADHIAAEVFTGRAAEHLRDKDMEIDALKPDAERGRRFRDNKRGLNRLYREALAVLEREGRTCSAKIVRKVLEQRRIITTVQSKLIWIDDRGKHKVTTIKQLDSRMGAIRKRLP